MNSYKVVFLPSEVETDVYEGATIMEAARLAGVQQETICGGKGSCGKCRIRAIEGNDHGIDSRISHLTPMTEAEQSHIDNFGLESQERLSCQARILGDITVFVPEYVKSASFMIRKEAGSRVIEINPAIRKYYLDNVGKVSVPQIFARLNDQYGLRDLLMDAKVQSSLLEMIQREPQGLSLTIWDEREIIRAEIGLSQIAYGLALDIGTTTVVGYLCSLNSGDILATEALLNPQIKFGEDIMSRIEFSRQNEGGLQQMNHEIITAVNEIANLTVEKAGITLEDISEIVMVGNTVMHHIFWGLNIAQLGSYPFRPIIEESIDRKAHDLGIGILATGNVHSLPIEDAFVGADNVGVLIAEEPYNQEEVVLIIDVGTNGELILGSRNRILSASCATGPAFEGGNIYFGMRASPGAIDHVRIDSDYEVKYSVIGNNGRSEEPMPKQSKARGICGSGIIDAVAEMLSSGIINKDGSFNRSINCRRLRTDKNGKPVFVIAWSDETITDQDIVIVQKDIRAIQLAMSAISTGVQLLEKRMGIDKPDKIILAGSFGSVINPEHALELGMFPKCDPENIRAVGNAAGDGARIALLNKVMRLEAQRVAREVEYIELTREPGFNDIFIKSTHFPSDS